MYPRLVTDKAKLKYNMQKMADMCHRQGLSLALVTKCVCAEKEIVELIDQTDADFVADSRLLNLKGIKSSKPRYLLRIAQLCEAADVIAHSEISQQSELVTLKALEQEAKKQQKPHKVVLMADMGDLREGVFFKDKEQLLQLAHFVKNAEMLELYGVSVNLTCFGGVLPDEKNLGGLVELAEYISQNLGVELQFISGGNSSSLTMLMEHRLPKGINNLRIGEGFLLGNDTGGNQAVPGFYRDAFTIEASIVELKNKPSQPIGPIGLNAFGETVSFPDRGEMVRAILAIGRQDVKVEGLTPVEEGIEVLGASSDHMIVNLTAAKREYRVGDVLSFTVDYGALLSASTSAYVDKVYI